MNELLMQFYPARFFGHAVQAINAPPLPEVLDALRAVAHGHRGVAVCWQRLADRTFLYNIVSEAPEFDVGKRLAQYGGRLLDQRPTEGSIILSKLLTP
jgi:hypothetical protein